MHPVLVDWFKKLHKKGSKIVASDTGIFVVAKAAVFVAEQGSDALILRPPSKSLIIYLSR